MALFITAYSKDRGVKISETQWHVGSPKPIEHEYLFDDYGPHRCYLDIQADGHELEHIKTLFRTGGNGGYSIPMPVNKRVVRWYGDIAATIIFNM